MVGNVFPLNIQGFQPKDVVLIDNEQKLVQLGFLIPAPEPYATEFPGLFVYAIPAGTEVRATGGTVSISWPFYGQGDCRASAENPDIDGWDFTGGMFAVAWLNDGDFCDNFFIDKALIAAGTLQDNRNGARTHCHCPTIISAALGSVADSNLFDISDTLFALVTTGFAITGTYEKIVANNVDTSDNVFFDVAGTILNWSAITGGNRILECHKSIINGFVTAANMIAVSDDDDIQDGVISDCILRVFGGSPTFITGITAATSANTTFLDNVGFANSPAADTPANLVAINKASDFPTQDGTTITLESGFTYEQGADYSTAKRFIVEPGAGWTSNNLFTPVVTYTGTDSMFTGVDAAFDIHRTNLSCASADMVFNFSDTTPLTSIFAADAVTILAAEKVGEFDDLFTVSLTNFAALGLTENGIELTGTQGAIITLNRVALFTTSATAKLVDLGSVVAPDIEMSDLVLNGPAGAIGISGLASSGNVTTGSMATVDKSSFAGGLTALENITSKDIRWDFQGNPGIDDTEVIAFGSMNGNATVTTIATADTYQAINVATVLDSDITSKLTLINATNGIYRVDSEDGLRGQLVAVINGLKGGATQDYRYAVSKNSNPPVFTAVGATAITSVTNSGGIARFNFTVGPTLFVGQLLDISAFVTETAYNQEGNVTVTGAGFFEISSIGFDGDDTGSFLSDETPYEPMEVKTTKVGITLLAEIDADHLDTLQIMQAPDGHTDDMTNTDLKLDIR